MTARAAPPLEVVHLFPTPLVIDRLPPDEAAALGAALLREVPDAPAGSGCDAAIARLIHRAAALAGRMTANVRRRAMRPFEAVVTPHAVAPGGTIEPPIRHDAFWRGFVLAGAEQAGGGDAGDDLNEIVLEDPRLPATMMEMPGLRLKLEPRLPPGGIYEPRHVVRLVPGEIVLFPGLVSACFRAGARGGARPVASLAMIAPHDG